MEGSPNILAWLALLMVAPLSFLAFARLRPLHAALTVLFGGAMVLPCLVGLDLPLLPNLDKEVLPPLWALVACIAMRPSALRAKAFRGPEALLLVACVGIAFTATNNAEPLTYGPVTIPGLTAYSALSDAIGHVVTWFPPFYLGRALVRSRGDLQTALRYLAIGGVLYSIPILIELRLSPQLHRWVYGFHQHDFIQTIRFGGYRPMVFMRHGLVVAMFVSLSLFAATALFRSRVPLRPMLTAGSASVLLAIILVFCKSTGAYFSAALALPCLLFLSPLAQVRVAVGVAALVAVYPIARSMGWIPVDELTAWMAEVVNKDRALSMWFRLATEDEILTRARERMAFGWGSFGRFHIYDPITGAQKSIIDGMWVIVFAAGGAVGWATLFGMMLWPIVSAAVSIRQIASEQDRRLVSALALIVALYVFEWVPNSSVLAACTFLAGALSGVVPGIRAEEAREAGRSRTDREPAGGAVRLRGRVKVRRHVLE